MVGDAGSTDVRIPPRKIAIGSEHPVKVAAATTVLRRVFPQAEVVALPVDTGVGAAPTSAEATIQGALTRARRAMEAAGADLGVGIEDGIEEMRHGVFLGSWAAVVDRAGRIGLGAGTRIALPPAVAVAARGKSDLGEVVRQRLAPPEVKNIGTIGWLTRRLVTREEAHRHAVAAALVPFLPESLE